MGPGRRTEGPGDGRPGRTTRPNRTAEARSDSAAQPYGTARPDSATQFGRHGPIGQRKPERRARPHRTAWSIGQRGPIGRLGPAGQRKSERTARPSRTPRPIGQRGPIGQHSPARPRKPGRTAQPRRTARPDSTARSPRRGAGVRPSGTVGSVGWIGSPTRARSTDPTLIRRREHAPPVRVRPTGTGGPSSSIRSLARAPPNRAASAPGGASTIRRPGPPHRRAPPPPGRARPAGPGPPTSQIRQATDAVPAHRSGAVRSGSSVGSPMRARQPARARPTGASRSAARPEPCPPPRPPHPSRFTTAGKGSRRSHCQGGGGRPQWPADRGRSSAGGRTVRRPPCRPWVSPVGAPRSRPTWASAAAR